MKARFLTMILAALAAASCVPDWAKENDADVVLTMTVLGQKGGSEETATTQLLSDVASDAGGTINDNAELTVRAFPKSPNIDDEFITTGLNDVFLQRYTVHYRRADGRSVQGVDVPHDLSGDMSGRVPVNGELVTSIIVVRHQQKLEPPLRNMSRAGIVTFTMPGQDVLHTVADITVYGITPAQRKVTTTGRLEIAFTDFADEN
jgi:hypothetical protein